MGWHEEENKLLVELPTLFDRKSPFIVAGTRSWLCGRRFFGSDTGFGGRYVDTMDVLVGS
jgi:hypothetical protein